MFNSVRNTMLTLGVLTVTCFTCGTLTKMWLAGIPAAFAEQCATQDWPAHQHVAHAEYCMAEGHPVGVRN